MSDNFSDAIASTQGELLRVKLNIAEYAAACVSIVGIQRRNNKVRVQFRINPINQRAEVHLGSPTN